MDFGTHVDQNTALELVAGECLIWSSKGPASLSLRCVIQFTPVRALESCFHILYTGLWQTTLYLSHIRDDHLHGHSLCNIATIFLSHREQRSIHTR